MSHRNNKRVDRKMESNDSRDREETSKDSASLQAVTTVLVHKVDATKLNVYLANNVHTYAKNLNKKLIQRCQSSFHQIQKYAQNMLFCKTKQAKLQQ